MPVNLAFFFSLMCESHTRNTTNTKITHVSATDDGDEQKKNHEAEKEELEEKKETNENLMKPKNNSNKGNAKYANAQPHVWYTVNEKTANCA